MKRLWVSGFVAALLSSVTVAEQQEWVETAGDVLMVTLPLTALTATYGLDDPEGRKAFVGAYLTTFAATHVLKNSVQKERPDGSDRLSFPSGHTSSAFSGASFLARRYGMDVGIPAYLSASFVGYSRVYADKHDVWDVVAGAGLAMLVNEAFLKTTSPLALSVSPKEGAFQVAWQWSY